MTSITPRLSVEGPGALGRFRFVVRLGDGAPFEFWLSRSEASALLQALQPAVKPDGLEVEQAVYEAYVAARGLKEKPQTTYAVGIAAVDTILTGLSAARRFIFDTSTAKAAPHSGSALTQEWVDKVTHSKEPELSVLGAGSAPERADDVLNYTMADVLSGRDLSAPAPAGDGALRTALEDRARRALKAVRRIEDRAVSGMDISDCVIIRGELQALSAPAAATTATRSDAEAFDRALLTDPGDPVPSVPPAPCVVQAGRDYSCIYLAQGCDEHPRLVPSVPTAGDPDVVQIIPPFQHPGYVIRRAKPRPIPDEDASVPPAGGEARTDGDIAKPCNCTVHVHCQRCKGADGIYPIGNDKMGCVDCGHEWPTPEAGARQP